MTHNETPGDDATNPALSPNDSVESNTLNSAPLKKSKQEIVLENLISLHGFVMVLAITNAIREFAITHKTYNSNGKTDFPWDLSFVDAGTFAICVFLIVRFYLGDLMFLKRYDNTNPIVLVVDLINIFANSLLLAFMTFFIGNPTALFKIVFVLIVLEVIWWIFTSITRWLAGMRNLESSIQLGHVVNVCTVVLICLYGLSNYELDVTLFTVTLDGEAERKILIVLLANLILDLIVNGPRYIGLRGYHITKESGDD